MNKMVLEEAESDLMLCLNLLEGLEKEKLPEKLRVSCCELLVWLIRLLADILSMEFGMESSNGSPPPTRR